MDIVTISNLKKYFGEGPRQVKALDGIDLTIEKGRFLSIVGASGSGKTTLLNTIGGLYEPTEGTVIVDGTDLSELTEEDPGYDGKLFCRGYAAASGPMYAL